MASSVNDVMNVIASPDYGIKKIAGTTQEILAILEGNSNSPNNINAIVNDVKNLLQTLVTSTTKNKSVEIDDKSVKLNQKHVKDILNETKGIRKAIDNLAKSLNKQGKEPMPAVAKLSSKASDRVAEAMIKDIEKQKGDKFSGIINTFKKLNDISFKDILVGKQKLNQLSKIFNKASEKLNVNDKDVDAIVKIINAAPEMVKSLSRMSWRVDRIIKKDVIGKLTEVLVGKKSLLTLVKKLEKHKKDFEGGGKSIKNISAIAGSLFGSSLFLVAALVTAGPAILGATLLEKMVDKFIPTIEKLSKSGKHMEKAKKSALTFVAVSGLMAVSSLFLATVAVTGVPALLGSVLMLGIVKISTSAFKMLGKAKKNILIGSLAMVAMSASLILFGIGLKKIVDATKGVSFKQVGIIAATTVLLGGAVALMGIPVVAGLIGIGSIALAVMGLALRPFAKTLSTISKVTDKIKMSNIKLVSESMMKLGIGVSKMALLMVPVTLGSITVNRLSKSLYSFAKSLKAISSIGSMPNKQVYQVLNAMETIGKFFKENPITAKIVRQSRKYKRMLRPFAKTIKHLAKLKEVGTVPMKLVHQTLDAMRAIANYYVENPITSKIIRQSRKYKRMLRPFAKTIKHMSKLKEMGSLPMRLVYQTLDAMKTIANYYVENPIKSKTVRQARKYKRMLKPFGKTIKNFVKLKELGSLPLKLVYQTLDTMKTIANYYIENPIKKKAIKQAKRYKKMLKPFNSIIKQLVKLKEFGGMPTKLVYQTLDTMKTIGNYYIENPIKRKAIKQAKRYKKIIKPFGSTIKHLAKLKELGFIPMKLVHQTLEAISAISDFYREQDLGFFEGTDARLNAIRISEIVSSFGNSAISLKPLKNIQNVPLDAINNIIEASNNINTYYNGIVLSDNIEVKGYLTEYIINSFSNTSSNIYNKFIDIDIEKSNAIKSITKNFIKAFDRIIKYYENSKFSVKMSKVKKINNAIISFTKSANYMKTNLQPFTKKDYNNIKYLIRAIDDILDLFRGRNIIYKKRMGLFKRKFVSVSGGDNIKDIQGRIKLFVNLANAASELSKVNSNSLKSVGESIYSTFDNIGKINMDNVYAVTNMFNAFNSINKSESIIDKFTESVKEFTNTCKDLMDAMNNNTNTINNIDGIGGTTNNEIIENTIIESRNNNSTQNGGVRIANVDEIARTIAEKINGALSVDIPDTQVQLLINGMGGNEWVISRY